MKLAVISSPITQITLNVSILYKLTEHELDMHSFENPKPPKH